ncbi:MAG: hypothetical protein AAGA18_00740 [Verrucomicrobiota bacterium]
MVYQAYMDSLEKNQPPSDLSPGLLALWWDKKGDWGKAHDATQPGGQEADWVHAYLHRKEGDQGNASYWYNRSSKTKPSCSLDQEWENIVRALSTN